MTQNHVIPRHLEDTIETILLYLGHHFRYNYKIMSESLAKCNMDIQGALLSLEQILDVKLGEPMVLSTIQHFRPTVRSNQLQCPNLDMKHTLVSFAWKNHERHAV